MLKVGVKLPWIMELACIMPDVASSVALNLVLLAIRMPDKSDGSNMCCKLADSLLNEAKPFALFKKLVSRYSFNVFFFFFFCFPLMTKFFEVTVC